MDERLEKMRDTIRVVINSYKELPEKAILEVLCQEAEAWEKRLEELELEEEIREMEELVSDD